MSFDAGSPNEKRGVSPLGRGLEEISHLFLSNPPAARAVEQIRDSARSTDGSLPRSRDFHGPSLTKGQVTATLMARRTALSDDVLAIGQGIVCSPYGEIDLLALDRTQQLAIIDVQITLDDGLLARGLAHVDWAVRNLRTVQRLFPGWAIDVSRQPRLVLVAPRFSLALRSGIRQIAGPSISCFRYREVELSGEVGLFVERL